MSQLGKFNTKEIFEDNKEFFVYLFRHDNSMENIF